MLAMNEAKRKQVQESPKEEGIPGSMGVR